MSRYKGQPKASRTEQEFPHQVDIIVPPGGLGRRLNDMYNFHIQNDVKSQRGHSRHDADGSVIRWCAEGIRNSTKRGLHCSESREDRLIRVGPPFSSRSAQIVQKPPSRALPPPSPDF